MAANTCTSATATVAGSDPNFTVTYKSYNHEEGVIFYVKYTAGTSTSLTITFDVYDRNLSASDAYRIIALSGGIASSLTYQFTTAGNYRIPVPMAQNEIKVVANVSFNAAAQGGSAVCNFTDN